MSALQASGFVGVVTQPYGLGWDMAAPLALSKDDLGWHSVIVGAKQGRRQKQIRSHPTRQRTPSGGPACGNGKKEKQLQQQIPTG